MARDDGRSNQKVMRRNLKGLTPARPQVGEVQSRYAYEWRRSLTAEE